MKYKGKMQEYSQIKFYKLFEVCLSIFVSVQIVYKNKQDY